MADHATSNDVEVVSCTQGDNGIARSINVRLDKEQLQGLLDKLDTIQAQMDKLM